MKKKTKIMRTHPDFWKLVNNLRAKKAKELDIPKKYVSSRSITNDIVKKLKRRGL